jgi:hypothetical protein
MESTLILEKVAYRISKYILDLPIFTIHDFIVCPVGYEEYVKLLIQEETLKCIGIKPYLKP